MPNNNMVAVRNFFFSIRFVATNDATLELNVWNFAAI
jgi:hypothetical protein